MIFGMLRNFLLPLSSFLLPLSSFLLPPYARPPPPTTDMKRRRRRKKKRKRHLRSTCKAVISSRFLRRPSSSFTPQESWQRGSELVCNKKSTGNFGQ